MSRIIKFLDKNLEEILLTLFLIAMTLIMGIQVFSRYVLGISLSWSEEITRYLFIWSAFLSVSYCTKKGISIEIDQFAKAFHGKGGVIINLVKYTIEAILFIYLIPYGWLYLRATIESGQVSPACHIPMYYIQAAPLISFVLCAIRVIQSWIGEGKKLLLKSGREGGVK